MPGNSRASPTAPNLSPSASPSSSPGASPTPTSRQFRTEIDPPPIRYDFWFRQSNENSLLLAHHALVSVSHRDRSPPMTCIDLLDSHYTIVGSHRNQFQLVLHQLLGRCIIRWINGHSVPLETEKKMTHKLSRTHLMKYALHLYNSSQNAWNSLPSTSRAQTN